MATPHSRSRFRLASAVAVAAMTLCAGCGSASNRVGVADATSRDQRAAEPIPSESVSTPPPFIDHVEWTSTPAGPSLQIYPTPSGRRTQGGDDESRAWREVLGMAATAGSPGMRAQFGCHWTFARLVEPDKPSWNLEPWRPVVPPQQMIMDRCNPGGPEI